jgi:SAM-dependent methyltransferase
MPQLPDDWPSHAPAGDATARFYDAVASGYDAQVDGRTDVDNLRLRHAFCERVMAAAGPGGAILDFGCGTGIDVAIYAARGHRVVAYDLSPGMVEVLRRRCGPEIEAGTVVAASGSLQAMEAALDAVGTVDAISANFAVLNHVRDLSPLLQRLAGHLAPDGTLMASVLNPFYLRDMRQGWWWRSALRSAWRGAIRMEGRVTTYRHFVGSLRRAALPAFRIERVEPAVGERGGRWGALASNHLLVVFRKLR